MLRCVKYGGFLKRVNSKVCEYVVDIKREAENQAIAGGMGNLVC